MSRPLVPELLGLVFGRLDPFDPSTIPLMYTMMDGFGDDPVIMSLLFEGVFGVDHIDKIPASDSRSRRESEAGGDRPQSAT